MNKKMRNTLRELRVLKQQFTDRSIETWEVGAKLDGILSSFESNFFRKSVQSQARQNLTHVSEKDIAQGFVDLLCNTQLDGSKLIAAVAGTHYEYGSIRNRKIFKEDGSIIDVQFYAMPIYALKIVLSAQMGLKNPADVTSLGKLLDYLGLLAFTSGKRLQFKISHRYNSSNGVWCFAIPFNADTGTPEQLARNFIFRAQENTPLHIYMPLGS